MTVPTESMDVKSATPTRRRQVLALGTVATLAASAGAGLAWWHYQPHESLGGDLDAWWHMSFDTPHGGTLAAQSLRGRPLLLNFWATWCPPCVDELPMLNTFYETQQARGWQILGLAVDQPSAVRTFLQKMPLKFPVGLAGLGGTDLSRSLGNLVGGLPFTVVFDAAGRIVQRRMGKLTAEDLRVWAAAVPVKSP